MSAAPLRRSRRWSGSGWASTTRCCWSRSTSTACAADSTRVRRRPRRPPPQDAGTQPASSTVRRAYDLVAAEYGPGANLTMVVAVDRTRGANPDEVAAELRRLPGVANVSAPVVDAAGDAAVLIVEPAGAPSDEATAALVDRVRAAVPAGVYVTGGAATFADIANRLADRLWVVIGFVVALSVVLLTLLLRAPVVVFVGFALDPDVTVKTLGIGMAVAVLIDATIVRMVLVPATMALIGRMNWWVPRWLDRLLPHVEGSSPVPAPPERELIKV